MDDLISRQAAIDALRYAQHRFTVADEAGGMGTVKWSEDVIYFAAAERVLAELPSADRQTDEEDQLKFYYVESIDDYWIGMRIDNFYYAEWCEGLGFVWTHSRYLPWGNISQMKKLYGKNIHIHQSQQKCHSQIGLSDS